MAANLDLRYYYGTEADQYNFYRIPKVLLTDSRYSGLSLGAKFLYGLLLDRMGLSAKNGWMDRERRVYIYFTLEDTMEQISCGHTKAVKLFSELEAIGLIERKKQGQGKPTRIYVKNFVLPQTPGQTPPEHPDAPFAPPEGLDTPPAERPDAAPTPEPSRESDGPAQSLLHMKPSCLEPEVKTAQNEKSETGGLPESGTPDFRKTEVLIMMNDTELNDTESFIYPYPSTPLDEAPFRRPKQRIGMDEMERYRERIRENIDYEALLEDDPLSAGTVDGYVELMADACCTHRDFVRVAGNELPSGVVKNRFLTLNREHIGYVLDCMRENTTFIRNIKAYTLAALYNAPVTITSYYAARVNHDLYGQAAS